MTPWFGLVIMLGLAGIFYKTAEFEDLPHPLVWACLSALLYVGAVHWLQWGICGALVLQIGLMVAMTCFLALSRPRGTISIRDLRRRYRLRRNRCPECNYDLQGIDRPGPCPECGAALPRSNA